MRTFSAFLIILAVLGCSPGEESPAPSTPEKVAVPKQCLPDALETLRRYPLDLVNWRHTNSRRLDILPLSPLAREPGGTLGKGFRIDGVVLPVDERYMKQWSDDPWELNSGGDGRELTILIAADADTAGAFGLTGAVMVGN